MRAAGPEARADSIGDPSMLPTELPLGPLAEVARSFGAEFAEEVNALPPGQWAGPLESPYGIHLVLVTERVESARPALADIRPLVEREFTADRRRRELDAMYTRLLDRYRVVIESRSEAPRAAAPAPPVERSSVK